MGRKTFIQKLISKEEKEQSISQRDARKIGPQKAVTPITRTKTFDSSISGPYHSKASNHTPKIKHPIQEQQGEASSQNFRTRGQGETEGEHQKPETGEHLLVYQYPYSSSAVKQLALELPEPSNQPARQSQQQFEECLV